jgi:Kef-type K+ transport system membrane component KefB/nucleotide-binding universal stress UspA family protein
MRLQPLLCLAATILAVCLANSAHAADAESAQGSEFHFIAAIVALLLLGRGLGEIMQRLGQPAVMGQLVAGILLGPSIFGAVWPTAQHFIFPPGGQQKTMLSAVSTLGILLILLLAGMETDLSVVRKVRKAALSASVFGIAIPFACGFALGQFLPQSLLPEPGQRLAAALFLGVALSISSVKIVAVVVRDMDFLRRDIGQVIIASAIVDDTIGWVIIAITISLVRTGSVKIGDVLFSVAGAAAFMIASFTFGRRIIFLMIRWTNDNFVSETPVITAILIATGCMALITDAIGVSTVLGAFVAGILVGQSPILSRHIEDELRGLITALFMPVFFGLSGLSADLRVLARPELLGIWLLIVLIASGGKFLGAFVGGRIGGLTRAQCLALAAGMNARGSTEIIVATIGLSLGAIGESLYTMIVAMAVVTTLAMPPTLRWALARLPIGDDERRRLDRESAEARGFFSDLERLLVAVDDSPSGHLAARLSGLIAGVKGMPVTLIRLGDAAAHVSQSTLIASAENASRDPANGDPEPRPVDVTTQEQTAPLRETIAAAAAKGHGALIVGRRRITAPEGGFSAETGEIANAFDGPMVLVSARGAQRADPANSTLDILAPMTAAPSSRRGAELAFRVASASGASVTALIVATHGAVDAARRGSLQPKDDNIALLREATRLGEQYGVAVKTAVRVNIAPADAILRQSRLGDHNLIVMGVNKRPGATLSFGDVAAAVLESSDRSLVFVSSGQN